MLVAWWVAAKESTHEKVTFLLKGGLGGLKWFCRQTPWWSVLPSELLCCRRLYQLSSGDTSSAQAAH